VKHRFPITVPHVVGILLLGTGLGLCACGVAQEPEWTPASSAGPSVTTEIWAETTTTFGQAQTTVLTSSPGATSTITTLRQQELKWGETAMIDGGAVTVEAPVADPAAMSPQEGFKVVYSLVTITNTGETPISYSQYDFNLEGRHSGGTGSGVPLAAGAQPDLEMGTLPPGQTVTGAVRFNLSQDDDPILVWLLVPWSEQTRLNWR
jgi:hypothetical protein